MFGKVVGMTIVTWLVTRTSVQDQLRNESPITIRTDQGVSETNISVPNILLFCILRKRKIMSMNFRILRQLQKTLQRPYFYGLQRQFIITISFAELLLWLYLVATLYYDLRTCLLCRRQRSCRHIQPKFIATKHGCYGVVLIKVFPIRLIYQIRIMQNDIYRIYRLSLNTFSKLFF